MYNNSRSAIERRTLHHLALLPFFGATGSIMPNPGLSKSLA